MNWPDGQPGGQLAEIKTILVLFWFVLWFGIERLRHRAINGHRWKRNLGLWMVNAIMSPLLILPISAWASQQRFDWRPDNIFVDLLILDAAIYGWHRLCHFQPFLWRFHAIHHLDQHLDTSTAVRFHVGEVLLSALARAGLMIIMDIDFTSVVIFETLVLMASIFHHADLRLPPRLDKYLSWFVVTPGWHHLHHHPDTVNTNSNYATILSLWDRLFTSKNPRQWQDTMPCGLDDHIDPPLWKLWLRPFLRRYPVSGNDG